MFRCLLASALCMITVVAQTGYRKPPQEVLDVLNAPLPPSVVPSPSGSHVLIAQVRRYPTIADLAQPWIGLAGIRVNPKTNARQLITYAETLKLKNVSTGEETSLAFPSNPRLGMPVWSPDGGSFALTHTSADAVELLVGGANGKIRSYPNVALNGVMDAPMQWTGNKTLLLRLVPARRGPAPPKPLAPPGPIVQEAQGQSGPVWTYQDMLGNPHDEDLFDYYGASQLAVLQVDTGDVKLVGKPAVLEHASLSPDGKSLLVTRLKRPYSYLHSFNSFPQDIEIWDASGTTVHTIAKLPLADKIPIGGVRTGPRNIHWLPTESSTLLWAEALDDGNPKRKVPQRDRLMRFRGPFTGSEPVEVTRFQYRYTGDSAIENTSQILVTEFDRDREWVRALLLDTAQPGQAAREVWSRASRDRYTNKGVPVKKRLPNGHLVIENSGGAIFLEGAGASPQGDRPFLDRLALGTLKTERLFQSDGAKYETFAALASKDGSRIITRRETPGDPPNFYLRSANGEAKALTSYTDPAPHLRKIRKQLVRYKRADGVDLSFTLYLPPDYKEGTKLPAVVYAYPTEFTDNVTAGQVSGSTQKFTTLAGISHLFYVLAGYAVLDDASIPIIGDPETVNNTYVEQLTASAKAAIDKAAGMGVIDPNRVGVIGHSYGAFMTANLLAHTNLFKAGVARSGAYNRTLTPFGFQSERRTFWESPEIYARMSPFTYANKIDEPILLIHGEKDNNPGTFPVQSERMYQAIRGNGGTVRYVVLPEESHGYQAKESVEHTLWEMISWFDRYVKNAKTSMTRN